MFYGDEDEKEVVSSTTDTGTDTAAKPAETATETEPSAETIKPDTNAQPDANEPGPIPYSRFKEVNDGLKSANERILEMADTLEQLQNQVAASQSATTKTKTVSRIEALLSKKYDDPLTQKFYEEAIAPLVQEFNELRQEINGEREQTTARGEADAITNQIDTLIAGQYKLADKEWVIARLITRQKSPKPGQSRQAYIADLCKASHETWATKEKSIRDEYLKGKKEESKHKSASPKGGAPAVPSPNTKGNSFRQNMQAVTAKVEEIYGGKD